MTGCCLRLAAPSADIADFEEGVQHLQNVSGLCASWPQPSGVTSAQAGHLGSSLTLAAMLCSRRPASTVSCPPGCPDVPAVVP